MQVSTSDSRYFKLLYPLLSTTRSAISFNLLRTDWSGVNEIDETVIALWQRTASQKIITRLIYKIQRTWTLAISFEGLLSEIVSMISCSSL